MRSEVVSSERSSLAQHLEAGLTDEQLMARLARGQQEALGPLYARYAPLIFRIASQSLDQPAAEEMVQEILLTAWRGAASFDPAQGSVKGWLLQLAHWRILNEVRRRRRRPKEEQATDDEDLLADARDPEPGPEEQVWSAQRREAIRSALAALPSKQRQAIALAFFGDLTHQEVAQALGVPLGTAKTRVRDGLLRLRLLLAPIAATLALIVLLGAGILHDLDQQRSLQRQEHALALLTSSETQSIRVPAVAGGGAPANAHASYRAQSGVSVAVVAAEHLPAAPANSTYQAWARIDGAWQSLGTFQPNADGSAILIAEGPVWATLPDAIQVTLEPTGGASQPGPRTVLAWGP